MVSLSGTIFGSSSSITTVNLIKLSLQLFKKNLTETLLSILTPSFILLSRCLHMPKPLNPWFLFQNNYLGMAYDSNSSKEKSRFAGGHQSGKL